MFVLLLRFQFIETSIHLLSTIGPNVPKTVIAEVARKVEASHLIQVQRPEERRHYDYDDENSDIVKVNLTRVGRGLSVPS